MPWSFGRATGRERRIFTAGLFFFCRCRSRTVRPAPIIRAAAELSQSVQSTDEYRLRGFGEEQSEVGGIDLLGREVKVLVDKVEEAGKYTVPFDGSAFASGVYFYRLVSGSFVQTRSMLLVK